jgi:hypothetical protein|tara:strand:- start:11977 stop:12600 length:624 start_codon:yes stop_codon:yes gene_type:complete
MKLHISPKIFKEIIKKSYSLDSIYLLKLIEEDEDVAPLYEDSMKIGALYQGLIRKGLISKDEEKITLEGKDLLKFIGEDNKSPRIVKRKPLVTDFEEWWKNYPTTDSFTYNNRTFKGSRSLRRAKNDCKVKFKSIINEGEYTPEQLIDALKYEVKVKVERSVKEGKNIMSYMQGSVPYLNQRTFEGFIELMQTEINNPEQQKGSTDI